MLEEMGMEPDCPQEWEASVLVSGWAHFGGAQRDGQHLAVLPAGVDAAPGVSPIHIPSLHRSLMWWPGCTPVAQRPAAAPVMAKPRKETVPLCCRPGAGAKGV